MQIYSLDITAVIPTYFEVHIVGGEGIWASWEVFGSGEGLVYSQQFLLQYKVLLVLLILILLYYSIIIQ